MSRPLLRKSDARRAFGDTDRGIALALGITPQAVGLWGRYVPELRARQLIEAHPELASKVTYAKTSRRRKAAPRANGQ